MAVGHLDLSTVWYLDGSWLFGFKAVGVAYSVFSKQFS